jgi:hypothetical protein
MTNPREDARRDELEDLIGAVAREMAHGEPPGDLPARVRDRIEGPRRGRWVWQTVAGGAVLLLAVVVGTVLGPSVVGPPEHIVTSLPRPQPEPSAAPPVPSPQVEPSSERARPAAPAADTTRAVIAPAGPRPDELTPMPGLSGLPAPEPLVVTVSAPTELDAPAEIVLTSIALEDLSIPPLYPWKESR